MPTIRNLLGMSRHTADVYRPATSQVAVTGYAVAQWEEVRSSTPVLSAVKIIVGGDETADEAFALGNVDQRMARMMWLDEDVRVNDVVLVHGPTGDPFDGKYFVVKKVNRQGGSYNVEAQQSAWIEQRITAYP